MYFVIFLGILEFFFIMLEGLKLVFELRFELELLELFDFDDDKLFEFLLLDFLYLCLCLVFKCLCFGFLDEFFILMFVLFFVF